MNQYDAIIIGTGQGGKPLALALAQAGWNVAAIEREHVGGTCPVRRARGAGRGEPGRSAGAQAENGGTLS